MSLRAPIRWSFTVSLGLALSLAGPGCQPPPDSEASPDPETFLREAQAQLVDVSIEAERADWVLSNFITHDTEILAAKAAERRIQLLVDLAKKAARYDGMELDPEVARKLELLKLNLTLPAPDDPDELEELTKIAASMASAYGRGRYCRDGGQCLELEDMNRVMADSRDPQELLDVWQGWRTVSPPMRSEYRRFAELGNKGARELGFEDLGAMWRSKYDMPAEDFPPEVDRLWDQVRPLYEALHCHVRSSLAEHYGEDVVAPRGPIPAHLLGNMWAQSWGNIYDLVAPKSGDPGYDLTQLLRDQGTDAVKMVKYAEGFFLSLGFEALPETFWERSLFVKPQDRDVVCHASAWDIDMVDDLRIKMCIETNAEDFSTVHHELGHNFYQRAYSGLDPLYRDSANDGFHEAVGDTLALSVTPRYLVDLGLLDEEPDDSADLGLLMRMALDKVAFLPFGLLVDQWRWKVFSGEIPPERYNAGWWELRERYQGVAAPLPRDEEDFDPGAKYHIPANTPYMRYFLAHILQFQFHRDLCKAAGYSDEAPLHRCSIYNSEEAGARLRAMLEAGRSRPWPEALALVGGSPEMDATAILDYFAPLQAWLDEANEGRTCGW